jgi:hypothetical protein
LDVHPQLTALSPAAAASSAADSVARLPPAGLRPAAATIVVLDGRAMVVGC